MYSKYIPIIYLRNYLTVLVRNRTDKNKSNLRVREILYLLKFWRAAYRIRHVNI